MAEILRKQDWTKDVDCNGRGNGNIGCGSLIRIFREDCRYYEGGGFREHNPEVVWRCPNCGVTNDLKKADYPANEEELPKWTSAWREGREPVD